MSNSHHFYGVTRIKGGFTIDTATIPANARYWRNSADDQLCHLQEVVGDAEGRRMTENITGSWKEIYESIKILADLAEKQAKKMEIK